MEGGPEGVAKQTRKVVESYAALLNKLKINYIKFLNGNINDPFNGVENDTRELLFFNI